MFRSATLVDVALTGWPGDFVLLKIQIVSRYVIGNVAGENDRPPIRAPVAQSRQYHNTL